MAASPPRDPPTSSERMPVGEGVAPVSALAETVGLDQRTHASQTRCTEGPSAISKDDLTSLR